MSDVDGWRGRLPGLPAPGSIATSFDNTEYGRLNLDPQAYAAVWLNIRYRLPLLRARLVVALAPIGGGQ